MKTNRKWLLGLNAFIIVYFILFLIWTEAPLPEEGSEVSFDLSYEKSRVSNVYDRANKCIKRI